MCIRDSNYNGARSLLRKCKEKFEKFSGIHRGINIDLLLKDIKKVDENYLKIKESNTFDWNCIPRI